MREKQQFIHYLKTVRKQLLLQLIFKELQFLFMGAGAASFILLLAASFIVIPFLRYYFLILAAGLIGIFIFRIWRKKPDLYEAACLYNSYVSDDRVLTAFAYKENEGTMEKLQLADAVGEMKKVHIQVQNRKKYFPDYKLLGAGAVLILVSFLLSFTIAEENMKTASQRETEIRLVKEASKELKKKVHEETDPDSKKLLNEALQEVKKEKDPEKFLRELEKQMQNLELRLLKEKEKQLALENWKKELSKNGLNELAELLDKKDLEKLEKELRKLNENRHELSAEQQTALNNLSETDGKFDEDTLARLLRQIEEALKSPEKIEQLAAAHSGISETGKNLQQEMIENGMPPSQFAFGPGSSGEKNNQGGQQNNQNGSSSGQNGQDPGTNNNGNGSGGSQSGSGGNNSGTGSGAGGQGNGSGGHGSGTGGTGAGLGQGSREFVTVPERVGGGENMETDGGPLGEGSHVSGTEGSGPVLKGTLKHYDEVYQQYERSYRQSINRYSLPSDLKEMVEFYFSNIDPNRE